MEMREIVTLLEAKIKMKLTEISRLEKEVAIARSVMANDLRDLYKVLNIHYPQIVIEPIEKEDNE